jgi:peptide/nickel transport system substrate-binding protein
VDANGQPQPLLATTWEAQSGDRRWQFWIRPNVRFHDGTPLTPAAAVASLTAGCGIVARPGVAGESTTTCPWTLARAVGDSVVFEFADSYPQFAAELALPAYGIAHAKTGTGPFTVSEERPFQVGLDASENYWQGRPYLNGISIGETGGERDRTLDLDFSRVDVLEPGPELLRRLQQQHARLAVSQPTELVALVLHPQKPALEDARLRRAIALSIDRAALHNFIFQKQGEVSGGLLPNWISGYAFLFAAGREVARAQQLHRELGAVPPLIIAAEGKDPALQLVADRIALNARDAGIVIQPGPYGLADLRVTRQSLASENPAVALQQMAAVFSGGHAIASVDSPQRLYEQERELLSQYYVVPLVYLPRTYALSPRVRNWNTAPDGKLRLQDVWVAATP